MKRLELAGKLYRTRRLASMKAGRFKKIQEKRLRSMLSYAYNHSVYYRDAFQAAGIGPENIMTAPLRDFPTLDKDTFMKHYNQLVTVAGVTQESMAAFDEQWDLTEKKYRNRYHVIHSSGSSGTAKYFLYDEEAWEAVCLGIIRGALWEMSAFQIIRLLHKKPRILYVAAVDGRYGGTMAVADGIEVLGAQCRKLSINMPLQNWRREVEQYQPDVIIGYPSAVKILADIKRKGYARYQPMRVITCGEPLSASLREYLQAAFQTDIVNFYGAGESLALGVETGTDGGMYLFDDLNYIEVLDGQMYLTSLYNKAQPLIRYRLTDKLALRETASRSGCPFTCAETIQGRKEDVLWFRDKEGRDDFLHPLSVEGFCLEGVMDYQFIQRSDDKLELLVELETDSEETAVEKELALRMQDILAEKKLDYVELRIHFVDRIRPDPVTGKKPLTVRK